MRFMTLIIIQYKYFNSHYYIVKHTKFNLLSFIDGVTPNVRMSVQGDYSQRTFHRVSCNFRDMSEKYRMVVRNFKSQYASLYRVRYERCLPMLRASVEKKWGMDQFS